MATGGSPAPSCPAGDRWALPIAPVDIPGAVMTEVARHARDAFPAECCGWLGGPRGSARVDTVRRCQNAQSEGRHPITPARGDDTAFVLADPDLIAFVRALDSDHPPLVLYHSHTDGRACFSATDRAAALSPWRAEPAYPVQHLVIGITATAVTGATLVAWSAAAHAFVETRRYHANDSHP